MNTGFVLVAVHPRGLVYLQNKLIAENLLKYKGKQNDKRHPLRT